MTDKSSIGTLYHAYGTRSSRVLWAIYEFGLAVTIKQVGLFNGELKTPEFKKLNPAAAIPVLEMEDLVLTESCAIVLHLVRWVSRHLSLINKAAQLDKFDADRKWGGELDSAQRINLYKWSSFCASVDNVPIQALFHRFLLPEGTKDASVVERQAQRWVTSVGPAFSKGLGSKKYFEGEEVRTMKANE